MCSPKMFESRQVKCRKPHKCCECIAEISKGDLCQYSKGMWEDQFETFYQCVECWAVFQIAMDASDRPCDVCFTQLIDWANELRNDYTDKRREAIIDFIDRRKVNQDASKEADQC